MELLVDFTIRDCAFLLIGYLIGLAVVGLVRMG